MEKARAIIEGAIIFAFIAVLFYFLAYKSAEHGGMHTPKGSFFFFIAVLLFFSPLLDKAIGLWYRLKEWSGYELSKKVLSSINLFIVGSGVVTYVWLSIHHSEEFSARDMLLKLWALITS